MLSSHQLKKMFFDFIKIDICLTCKLAILKNLLKKKTILILLLFLVGICLLSHKSSRLPNKFQPLSKHKLCVIVPFRNRFNQLIEFIPHLTKFLFKQNVNHQLLIINQIDNFRFNRASLINVGYRISENHNCDYIGIHDVDLLPNNDDIKYYYPKTNNLMHLSSPGMFLLLN